MINSYGWKGGGVIGLLRHHVNMCVPRQVVGEKCPKVSGLLRLFQLLVMKNGIVCVDLDRLGVCDVKNFAFVWLELH